MMDLSKFQDWGGPVPGLDLRYPDFSVFFLLGGSENRAKTGQKKG